MEKSGGRIPQPGRLHRAHAAAVVKLATDEREQGRIPIVLADANAGHKSQWTGTLANQLKAAGFVVVGHKVDLIDAHPDDLDLESQRVLGPEVVGNNAKQHSPIVVGWRGVSG